MAFAVGSTAVPIHANAAQKRPNQKPLLRFGILTDIHVGTRWMMGINTPAVEKAFRNFRERDVDGIMICGDITNSGTIKQLEIVQKTWNQVFPKNQG